MSANFSHDGSGCLGGFLAALRRHRRRAAQQALVEELAPELLADIGLSESGEFLLPATIEPALRPACDD